MIAIKLHSYGYARVLSRVEVKLLAGSVRYSARPGLFVQLAGYVVHELGYGRPEGFSFKSFVIPAGGPHAEKALLFGLSLAFAGVGHQDLAALRVY